MKMIYKKLQEKVQKSLTGRYGADEYSKTLAAAAAFLFVLSALPKFHFLIWLSMVSLLYALFRCYSRNYIKRLDELGRFREIKEKYGHRFSMYSGKYQDEKEIQLYYCKNCKVRVRVIKGKEQVSVSCPKCGTELKKYI